LKSPICGLFLASVSCFAFAHGFEERYDLPVPLAYVITGACLVVLLTFLVAALFMRAKPADLLSADEPTDTTLNLPVMGTGVRFASWLMAVLIVVSALWGTSDPLMNLAPTFVWIIWWVGLGFAVVVFGDFWPWLDPWASTFDVLNALIKRLGLVNNLSLRHGVRWRWPKWLGAWPAVFLLLAWSWTEVVYPIASNPRKLGWMIVAWTVVSLIGMWCFGKAAWQKHFDVFALYFATLGKVSIRRVNACPAYSAGEVAFVIAMLSTVLFDGLRGGGAWAVFENYLKKLTPTMIDVNGYYVGTVGLVVVWVSFLVLYLAVCYLCARLLSCQKQVSGFHQQLAHTLIPIAAAYNVAHNFSNLVIQGQTFLQLLSDPLGRQWDLFGTAKLYPNIGIIDAKVTWFVAVFAIVIGHVISIWLSHRVALRYGQAPVRTLLATFPLTLLMIFYTAVSLLVIAEPMLQ
jgi:hypothetical protein